MSDPLSTLALATGGAFLGKFVGPAAESLGKVAWERAQQIGQKATALLIASGREPKSVEPKLLVPLIQAAALESDESLSDKWAALLANAADPAQRVQIQPGFVVVLQQLTPTDARVVEQLYQAAEGISGMEKQHTVFSAGIMSHLKLTEQEMRLSMDTLLRLQLCRAVATHGGYSVESFVMPSALLMTTFGLHFTQACAPPTA